MCSRLHPGRVVELLGVESLDASSIPLISSGFRTLVDVTPDVIPDVIPDVDPMWKKLHRDSDEVRASRILSTNATNTASSDVQ